MANSNTIFQFIKSKIPEKYRLITFLVLTSIIGVTLIIFAVYNASRDLERLNNISSLYEMLKMNKADRQLPAMTLSELGYLSDDYRVWIVKNNRIVSRADSDGRISFEINLQSLLKSRINDKGGFLEKHGQVYTWAVMPVKGGKTSVILLHRFSGAELKSLASTFIRRLVIPAIFVIWMMVWVGLILRYLTDKLIEKKQELEQMALHDWLTGLPNRVLLEDRLQQMIESSSRNRRTFAVAVMDLNRFKEINDTFGHDQGDQLLCQVSERIKSVLRATDTCARIGGDEFVLLLDNVDRDGSLRLCERLREEVVSPYTLSDATVDVGISLGIAMYPENGEDSQDLIRNADIAMYYIKVQGGSISFYDVYTETAWAINKSNQA